MLTPADKNDPLVTQMKEAIVALGVAHGACQGLFPSGLRTGTLSATWVGDALVVTANGACADDLKALLYAARLADPERAA